MVVEGVEVGERRVVGELHGLVDPLDRLLVHRLDLVLLQHALVHEPLGEGGDRVALAPLLDLLLGAVLLRVGHGVAAVAVGHGLHELRLALLARAPERVGHDGVHVEHVHAVALGARHAEALRLQGEVGDRRVPVERGAHAELVVDDQEDHRQLPERGEVHRLAEGALVGGAVAHHREDHVLGALVVGGERDARGERERAADDAVAAEEAPLAVEEVHRAATASRGAVLAAEQLGHHGVRVRAARERLAVLAIGRHEVVGFAQRLGGADDGALLADREVEEAADLGLGVHLAGALLEAADEHHLGEDEAAGLLVREGVRAALGLAVIGLLARAGALGGHRTGLYPVPPGRHSRRGSVAYAPMRCTTDDTPATPARPRPPRAGRRPRTPGRRRPRSERRALRAHRPRPWPPSGGP